MAHLVMDGVVCVWQLNALLEMIPLPIELDGLGPIVEGAGDEDLGGGMSPMRSRSLSTAVADEKHQPTAVIDRGGGKGEGDSRVG